MSYRRLEPQECYQWTVCGETLPDESKAIVHAQIGHSLPSEGEYVFQLSYGEGNALNVY